MFSKTGGTSFEVSLFSMGELYTTVTPLLHQLTWCNILRHSGQGFIYTSLGATDIMDIMNRINAS